MVSLLVVLHLLICQNFLFMKVINLVICDINLFSLYNFSFNFVDSIYFSNTEVYLFVKTLFLLWLLCFM